MEEEEEQNILMGKSNLKREYWKFTIKFRKSIKVIIDDNRI